MLLTSNILVKTKIGILNVSTRISEDLEYITVKFPIADINLQENCIKEIGVHPPQLGVLAPNSYLV